LHKDDAIPDGAAYELRDLALRLGVPERDALYEPLHKAIQSEAVRILRRKQSQRGTTTVAKEILDDLEEMIMDGEVEVGDLADELIVARTFAEAMTLAGQDANALGQGDDHADMDH